MEEVPRFARRATALVAGLALVGGLAACAPPATDEPTVTTLKTNVVAPHHIPANWSPGEMNTYFLAPKAVYESLVQLNGATGEYEPLLAESFEIGEDQRTMDLTLREDVDFTDGTHLDAEAAKEAFEFALDGPAHAPRFSHTEVDIEVTGEYGLRITSTAPMNEEFMFAFVIVPIASPAAIRDDPEGLAADPVGTGPYVLDEQVPEVSVSFERNTEYRDANSYPFDRLEFTIFADPIAASNALKSGQLNIANLDLSLVADAEAEGFSLHTGGGNSFVMSWSDVDGAIQPALTDVRVRQAIAHAIDRDAIVDAIEYGYGSAISQSWGPTSIHYVEGEDDRYEYDLNTAKALMAEAGYADGFDLAMPSYPALTKYEPVLTQALADIGVRLTFDHYVDYGAWAENGTSYALVLGWNADLFLANGLRLGGILLPAYPELAAAFDAMDNGSREEASEAAREIGRIVLDEALVIAVSRPLEVWASIPEITLVPGLVQAWPPLLSHYQFAD